MRLDRSNAILFVYLLQSNYLELMAEFILVFLLCSHYFDAELKHSIELYELGFFQEGLRGSL